MRIAVLLAIFGQEDLTSNVLKQISTEAAVVDVYLCDNKGDYGANGANVIYLPQQENLGWLRGTNVAWRASVASGVCYDAFVLINNDVVLSPNFFTQLFASARHSTLGIVGPAYNCARRGQHTDFDGDPAQYKSQARVTPVAVIDGTCMMVYRSAFERVGYLDEQHFTGYGWGADVDYCIRARRAGFTVAASHLAYLYHIGWVTAAAVDTNYKLVAYEEYVSAMRRRYGFLWAHHLELGYSQKWFRIRTHLKEFLFFNKTMESRRQWIAQLPPRTRFEEESKCGS